MEVVFWAAVVAGAVVVGLSIRLGISYRKLLATQRTEGETGTIGLGTELGGGG